MSSELSGVRSSCDMFARNSLLYFEVSASWRAFSSSCRLACLDLAVLLLDFFVLRGEQPRLLFQLFVRLLQLFLLLLEQLLRGLQRLRLRLEALVGLGELFLLRLQLLGERLRLREQLLRPHVRLDRVEHDADRLGELIEQRLIGLGEAREAGQLHHRQHLPFEDDRQHDDVQRLRLRRGRS